MIRLSRSAGACALLIGTASLALPQPAHAQVGGLIKRKLGESAVNKALGEAPSDASRAPAFDERVLEITSARLDQLLKGLAAEQAERRRVDAANAASAKRAVADEQAYEAKKKEYDRAYAAYQPKADAYAKCVTGASFSALTQKQDPSVRQANERIMAMPLAERERLQQRMTDLEERKEAAEARGDKGAAAALADSAGREYERATGVSAAAAQRGGEAMRSNVERAAQKCGPEPVAPVEPQAPQSAETDAGQLAAPAAVRASGLPGAQYAILRERVAAYVAMKGDVGSSGYAYSAAELGALKARLSELARYEAQLTDEDAARWSFEGE